MFLVFSEFKTNMDNTSVTVFTMTAYAVMENNKYLQFSIFMLLYILIISFNLLLIAVICCQRALHQPMYVFICNLAANGLYGSTGFLPSTLILLLSETYEISLPWCLIQIYWVHTYAAVEFHILAVMGYDRYVAICYPLHYHSIMSISKVCKLVALAWLYPFSLFLMYFCLTLRLKFCGRFIHFKLFCVNFELVKNACSNTFYHSIVGLVLIAFIMIPQLLMIIFSYAHIFRVCLKSSKESQVKALKTCIPHLLSVINYSIGGFFEIAQSRFNMSGTSFMFRIIMSLYYTLLTPLINPAIYGMANQAIRMHVLKIYRVSNRLASC